TTAPDPDGRSDVLGRTQRARAEKLLRTPVPEYPKPKQPARRPVPPDTRSSENQRPRGLSEGHGRAAARAAAVQLRQYGNGIAPSENAAVARQRGLPQMWRSPRPEMARRTHCWPTTRRTIGEPVRGW